MVCSDYFYGRESRQSLYNVLKGRKKKENSKEKRVKENRN